MESSKTGRLTKKEVTYVEWTRLDSYPLSSRFSEAGVTHLLFDLWLACLCNWTEVQIFRTLSARVQLLLSHDPFSLSLSLLYYLILNPWYWTLDIEPLILNPWYWPLILTLMFKLWLEPLIMTWPLVHDIGPWPLTPQYFTQELLVVE